MSRLQRNWSVGILLAVSLVCAITFAVLLGQLIHIGQRAVGSGGPMPSANGWIALVLTAVGSIFGGRWAAWLAKAAEFGPMIESGINQLRGQSAGPADVKTADGSGSQNGTGDVSVATDLGDLQELVAATVAWAKSREDRSLERRWALACLGALKDVASFESPAVAGAIALVGNAVITECLGAAPVVTPSKEAVSG